jgi:hypothetical protein
MSHKSFSLAPVQRSASAAINPPEQTAERGNHSGLQATAIQCKLSAGPENDPHERQADAMADHVMRMPQPNFIQRKCAHCEDEEVQRKPLASFIQRKETASSNTASDSTHSQIESTRGGGATMPANTKSFMESRFGADFSNVRIHSGNYASQLSGELNAQAFTVGNDIYFNEGKFLPESSEGKHLLAHELTHTMQQGNSSTLRRKCDLPAALKYYSTPAGSKIDYKAWLEKARKVVGTTEKPLYNAAAASGTIGKEFVLLMCKTQQLLNIREDGKAGAGSASAFDKFATGGEHGIDYTRLFKDKKLEIGIAIGDDFQTEFTAVVAMLEARGKTLKNFSSIKLADRQQIKFTKSFPVQGDRTAAPVDIKVVIDIINSDFKTPKQTFTSFLSQKEIAIYSGHARYGTGPDFDAKASVKENFIIGVNSALHKAGKLTAGYDKHMNEILDKQGNDLEAMSKAGKIDPDTYQVWFFNACSSIQYLDEVRKGLVTDKTGKIKSSANLRFAGTTSSIYSDAIKIVSAIIDMNSMDEIFNIMNANEIEEVKRQKEKPKKSYYFSD